MIDIYILTHTMQTKDFCCNVTFFFFFSLQNQILPLHGNYLEAVR